MSSLFCASQARPPSDNGESVDFSHFYLRLKNYDPFFTQFYQYMWITATKLKNIALFLYFTITAYHHSAVPCVSLLTGLSFKCFFYTYPWTARQIVACTFDFGFLIGWELQGVVCCCWFGFLGFVFIWFCFLNLRMPRRLNLPFSVGLGWRVYLARLLLHITRVFSTTYHMHLIQSLKRFFYIPPVICRQYKLLPRPHSSRALCSLTLGHPVGVTELQLHSSLFLWQSVKKEYQELRFWRTPSQFKWT